MLIADVCTTGTQVDAVAGVLLDEGGAARVEGVVLARAVAGCDAVESGQFGQARRPFPVTRRWLPVWR